MPGALNDPHLKRKQTGGVVAGKATKRARITVQEERGKTKSRAWRREDARVDARAVEMAARGRVVCTVRNEAGARCRRHFKRKKNKKKCKSYLAHIYIYQPPSHAPISLLYSDGEHD